MPDSETLKAHYVLTLAFPSYRNFIDLDFNFFTLQMKYWSPAEVKGFPRITQQVRGRVKEVTGTLTLCLGLYQLYNTASFYLLQFLTLSKKKVTSFSSE